MIENEFFDTHEEAEILLEKRKKAAYERIEKRGDKIIEDRSFVGRAFMNDQKWTTYLLITTEQMIEDLSNYKPIDAEAELVRILKEELKKTEK